MADRYFTVAEANAALAEVRPIAEQMVAQRRRLAELAAERAELATQIAGNGGGLDAGDLGELEEEIDQLSTRIGTCVAQLDALGVLVKGLDDGLVDFPALRDGEEVLLCWRLGEPELAHWHPVDEGFAGRKPLERGE